ncbi:MAG: RdgB/HAM1 family non-canonical purine NTP pyrophosphatase [Clostridiales bacterium]|nr:RdgB/HAM1 family non-canonical purine NTP pyrophosphatase [Clostridiales bacterium]
MLLATENRHKLEELFALLGGSGLFVRSLRDFPSFALPPETGETFRQNAAIKALYGARESGLLTVADDSGLCVEHLGGAPGVHSARFAGEQKDDAANNAKLLSLLRGVPKEQRGAAFHCVIAVAGADGRLFFAEGVCRGLILDAPCGQNGFGYDPLFYLPELGRSFAQLTREEKNRFSHRARALEAALPIILREC